VLLRDHLTAFLKNLYHYETFQDYCENGLQVEGQEEVHTIVFGVSFNLPFLQRALEKKPEAVIVHHGIFQSGDFKLTGTLKQKVKILIERGISLYGIHLPMDAHPEVGHGVLLLSVVGAGEIEPFAVGAWGENAKGHSLDRMLEIFHRELHPGDFVSPQEGEDGIFSLSSAYGFRVLRNGPVVPKNLAVITGGAAGFYEKAIARGADTFFCGDIKEQIPAISLETRTNFVNLGHYFSEKPGVLALKKLIAEKFAVRTEYIEIPNPV
jgi:dinuclear metal center YbgI/SA1388 family protein